MSEAVLQLAFLYRLSADISPISEFSKRVVGGIGELTTLEEGFEEDFRRDELGDCGSCSSYCGS